MAMSSDEFSPDGLLPRVEDDEIDWLRPSLMPGTDYTEELVSWFRDIGESTAIVWPAVLGGQLRPPPPIHVLDHLVRDEFAGASIEIEAEFFMHPQAGTIAVMGSLPPCDTCKMQDGSAVDARYDTKLKAHTGRASLCPVCYMEHGTGRLGVGEGQYLLLSSEVSADVLNALEVARGYWQDRLSGTS